MSKIKSLVAKAKGIPLYKNRIRQSRADARFSPKEIEALTLAWFVGEVSWTQAEKATGFTGSSLYGMFATTLKRLYAAGRIKVVKQK
ncbi:MULTISPECIES: hypothetical protein [unclassified Bradyrhizobium]|jgi:hypothetical protein|uniref:hypothetical protein n=1 Tax=unclassified Bradyrhizobium TaxID=2631580 RepID=UPI001053BDA8|nr:MULTISPECIES: hypothetical protein [unclassified Bradyrhizobium]